MMLSRFFVRPRAAFDALGTAPRLALTMVGVEGIAWAMVSAMLAVDGHSPSGPVVLPVAPESYYETQLLFALPLVFLAVIAQAFVMHGLAVWRGGVGTFWATLTVTGLSTSVPTLALWLLPDVVAYLVGGFDALAPTMRATVPLALLWSWVLGTSGLRSQHDLTGWQGLAIAAAGLVVRGAVLGPLLR